MQKQQRRAHAAVQSSVIDTEPKLPGLSAIMYGTDAEPCLLAVACTAGSCRSSAVCSPATPAARPLLVAMLPCSSASVEEEEEAAGWVWYWAGAAEEEEGWTEAGCSVGTAAEAELSLLLLLVMWVLRATAELDRSVARSSSCSSPCQCSWNRVMRSREMSSSSSLSPPPANTALVSARKAKPNQ